LDKNRKSDKRPAQNIDWERIKKGIDKTTLKENPEQVSKDDLVSQISDRYKELNGFRPRLNFSEYSTEQLAAMLKEIEDDLRAEMDMEKKDDEQHSSAIEKAKTPPKWNVGDIAKLKETNRKNSMFDKNKKCTHPNGFEWSGKTPNTGVQICRMCGAVKPPTKKQTPRLGMF
jgi:hypothetical protein